MSGRQYSLGHEAEMAKLYSRLHIMETSGPYVQSYRPVWGSTGTAPAIGNGTIAGKYILSGKLAFVWINMVLGSTSTIGTGNYTWTLPTIAHNSNNVAQMQGTWTGTPTAGTVYGGITNVNTGFAASLGTCSIQVGAAAGAYGGHNQLTGAIPGAWVSGGSINMTFIYETS